MAEAIVALRIETPTQLQRALAARRLSLGMTQLQLDDRSGVQQGYSGKLEKGLRGFGDMSLSATLGALNARLLLVFEDAAIEHGPMSADKADHMDRRAAAPTGEM
jgi:transcriptional regulator with XRE-family HTH domain